MHCILLLSESQEWRLEPNILTWCVGQKPRSFRKAFPGFTRVTGASAPIEKNIHTFTVPFLRRGFSPRFSVLCAAAQSRVPKYANILFYKTKLTVFQQSTLCAFLRLLSSGSQQNCNHRSPPLGAHFEHAFFASVLTVLKQSATLSTE